MSSVARRTGPVWGVRGGSAGLFASIMRPLVSGMYYTKSHEWVDVDMEKKCARVGVTEFAQHELGDVVFVDFPDIGKNVKQNEALVGIESVKAAADVSAPLSGSVQQVNKALVDSPSLINKKPETDGWIVDLKLNTDTLSEEEKKLLTRANYTSHVASSKAHSQ